MWVGWYNFSMSSGPSGAYAPTSSDEEDYVEISASASVSTLEMTDSQKHAARRRKEAEKARGGFGFGRALHDK